jgi:MFS family permease
LFIQRQIKRVRNVYYEYPGQFWVLILGTFIDRLGGALMFPFFTLYITRKFDVGMTEVGVFFGLFSVASVAGSSFGGAMTDYLGRKGMLIFGLIASALSSLLMGLVGSIELFFATVLVVGIFAHAGNPAQQAMVADLLPEAQRAQGYGILRVVANLAVAIGPGIGGLLAARSYLLLFACDAVTSLITAGVVALAIKETKPTPQEGEQRQTMAQTFGGYWRVLRDAAFALFLLGCILRSLVSMQMITTLPVYLQDVHGVSEQGFGYLVSLNAAMVVLLQFPITRWIRGHRPLMMMAVGMVLYAVGFGLYSVVSAYVLFLVAVATLTVGEMVTAPTSQALASRFAPEAMRGRYMAVYGFSWAVPTAFGPLLAGLIMDNADPRWVWYATGLVGLLTAGLFVWLQRWTVGNGEGVQ